MNYISVFYGAILPILLIAGVGYLLGSLLELGVEGLNKVTLYLLAPCLAFHSFATSSLAGSSALRVMVGVILFILLMMVVSAGVAWILGLDQSRRSTVILTSTFPNSGNFGIPLSEFAFGPIGRVTAILFVTVQNLLVYSLGVMVAARGGGRKGMDSLGSMFKLPLVYAALAAVLVRWVQAVPGPENPFMQTVKMLGDASIPVMLIILGIQLSNIQQARLSYLSLPVILKLGFAPLLGLGLALGLGFYDGGVAQVFVLECSMPSAVLPLILTVAYESSTPEGSFSPSTFVSSAILVTTLLSMVTLTLLIVLLRTVLFV